MGRESWQQGFNVLLAGSVNLQRDPRNGRNFEYAGEDPLLAGRIVGESIRGVQAEHVVSTIKHYAMNDMETARNQHSAQIGEQAMRESDLLAFELALGIGEPGSVMCAYNRINGVYACEHDQLLNRVLKQQWHWSGYVMSDWGGVHSGSKAALAGLDQQSAGEVFDKAVFFDQPLRMAVAAGIVPQARLDDMAQRILYAFFATGAFDALPQRGPIDAAAGLRAAQQVAEEGSVPLRNEGGVLPIAGDVQRIAVIGGHADKGVIGGGGSSMVGWTALGTNAVPGLAPTTWPGPVMFHPSSPLLALRERFPQARIDYLDGRDRSAAARLAAQAQVAIVFATQWSAESVDLPDMRLPDQQDALIAAVVAANPRTVVVLETNGPVRLAVAGASTGAAASVVSGHRWRPGDRRPAQRPRQFLGSPAGDLAGGRVTAAAPAHSWPWLLAGAAGGRHHRLRHRRGERWLQMVRRARAQATVRLRPWPVLHPLPLRQPGAGRSWRARGRQFPTSTMKASVPAQRCRSCTRACRATRRHRCDWPAGASNCCNRDRPNAWKWNWNRAPWPASTPPRSSGALRRAAIRSRWRRQPTRQSRGPRRNCQRRCSPSTAPTRSPARRLHLDAVSIGECLLSPLHRLARWSWLPTLLVGSLAHAHSPGVPLALPPSVGEGVFTVATFSLAPDRANWVSHRDGIARAPCGRWHRTWWRCRMMEQSPEVPNRGALAGRTARLRLQLHQCSIRRAGHTASATRC